MAQWIGPALFVGILILFGSAGLAQSPQVLLELSSSPDCATKSTAEIADFAQDLSLDELEELTELYEQIHQWHKARENSGSLAVRIRSRLSSSNCLVTGLALQNEFLRRQRSLPAEEG